MLDVLHFPCKYFPYRAISFSCWMQHHAFARISPTNPTLFHSRCNTLPMQGFPLQRQPFFMLDEGPCLCKDLPYRSIPFSCWMQHLASARISTKEPALFHAGCSTFPLQVFPLHSQPFFLLDAVPFLCKDFHYSANPFSC